MSRQGIRLIESERERERNGEKKQEARPKEQVVAALNLVELDFRWEEQSNW